MNLIKGIQNNGAIFIGPPCMGNFPTDSRKLQAAKFILHMVPGTFSLNS